MSIRSALLLVLCASFVGLNLLLVSEYGLQMTSAGHLRYHSLATRQVTQDASDRKKTLIIDLLLGVALPLLTIPLHYIVQGHRAGESANAKCDHSISLSYSRT